MSWHHTVRGRSDGGRQPSHASEGEQTGGALPRSNRAALRAAAWGAAIQRAPTATDEAGVFTDPNFPGYTFTRDDSASDEFMTVYRVTGTDVFGRAAPPASVYFDGGASYYTTDDEEWDGSLQRVVVRKLDEAAEQFHGERCHECATAMQDAFKAIGGAEVYEIEDVTDARITVMGSLVRNHYVTEYDGLYFDSRTGSAGEHWGIYLATLQGENPGVTLRKKVAEPVDT